MNKNWTLYVSEIFVFQRSSTEKPTLILQIERIVIAFHSGDEMSTSM